MQFSKIFPKEKKRKRSPLKGISSGELSIKIKKSFDFYSLWCLTDTSSGNLLPTPVGDRTGYKMDGPLKKVHVWFIFDLAQQKKQQQLWDIFTCPSGRRLKQIRFVIQCSFSPVPAGLCCIRFSSCIVWPTSAAQSPSTGSSITTVFLWGILLSASVPHLQACQNSSFAQMWDSPFLNWKYGLMSGLRGMIGAVHPIRNVFQLSRLHRGN